MNLGDVTDQDRAEDEPAVSPPRTAARSSTRTLIPHRVHEAIGVLGAVSVATACLLPGSVAAEVAGARRRTTGATDRGRAPDRVLHRRPSTSTAAAAAEVTQRRPAAHRPPAHARRGPRARQSVWSRAMTARRPDRPRRGRAGCSPRTCAAGAASRDLGPPGTPPSPTRREPRPHATPPTSAVATRRVRGRGGRRARISWSAR